MNAFTQELAAARFRVGTADDRVEHLIHRQDALYPVLQDARQRYHALSDLYAHGRGGFGLELEYHRHRNIYYSIREDYLELCHRFDEAEEILDGMIADGRALRARVELLRRRAAMEQENEYFRSEQGHRYARPDCNQSQEEDEPRYQYRYDHGSQSPRFEERRPRSHREQHTRYSSRSYAYEEHRPRSRQERRGQESFRGHDHQEYGPDFGHNHRRRDSTRNERRHRDQPRQERPPRSATSTPASGAQDQHLPRPSDGVVNGWWKVVNDSFKDYLKMDRFPNPPACTFCDEGHCDSSIKALLRRIPGLNAKKERLRWHPDRFSVCKEEKREQFKKRAGNVFIALDEMSKE